MALIDSFDPYSIKSVGGTSGGGIGGGMVAAGVVSGLSDIAQGLITAQRTRRTYDFNAKMAQLQGRMTRLAADKAIKDIRQKAASLYGEQKAAYAKRGISTTEGSPLAVMFDSFKEAELDEIYTNINADYAMATGDTQAGIYRMQGKSAQYDAVPTAAKTLLQMGTKAYTRG